MFSIRPHISKSFSPSTNPLVTVPSAEISIGITLTFMFHRFFQFRYLSLFSLSYSFNLWSAETAKSINSVGSLFLLTMAIIIIIIIIISSSSSSILLLEFFTPVLADGLTLELERQLVSSSFHDYSQYSNRSLYYCSLNSLLSSYFLVHLSLYQSFGDCTKSTNYNYRHFMFHSFFFSSLTRSTYFSIITVIIIYSFRVFHTSVKWWSFTRVWVTVSFLKSPGLVTGFWPFLAVLSFG